jgi:hypothetical protein
MLLCCLHDCLQAVLGWTDSHLHQFEKDGKVWSAPEWFADHDIEVVNESKTPLDRVLKAEGDSIVYEYDFGDRWLHEVALEKIVPCETALTRPVCLGGKRSRPPEDVGGVTGYNEFLDGFQPEYFDLAQVNQALERMRWPRHVMRLKSRVQAG